MHAFFAAALAQERLQQARVSGAIGDDRLLNRALEILFDLATCQSVCRHGDHIIESLCGRIINQAIAGIIVDAAGFHDEAMGAVRSIGEITNLLALFRIDPSSFRTWASASDIDRRKKFSPVKVRLAIDRHGLIAIPMDQFVYENMCERYVHVNPSTSPNSHGNDGLKHVGGHVQSTGSAELHQSLSYIVLQASMLASSILDRRDLVGELSSGVKAAQETKIN
jgi:hypothetical protein